MQTRLDSLDLVEGLVPKENRELVFAFFLVFARFEYALKRTGFTETTPNGAVMASWGRFSSKYRGSHQPSEIPKLKGAWDYFVATPPRKQVLKNGVLDWSDPWHRTAEPELTWLCDVLKIVRNNLFHGGKFSLPTGPIGEPARNKELLEHGLKVLEIFVGFDPEVRTTYFDTAS